MTDNKIRVDAIVNLAHSAGWTRICEKIDEWIATEEKQFWQTEDDATKHKVRHWRELSQKMRGFVDNTVRNYGKQKERRNVTPAKTSH